MTEDVHPELQTSGDAAPENAESGGGRLIELGWLIYNELDRADLEAVTEARATMLSRLRELFPQFTWRMPVVRWSEPTVRGAIEAVALLQEGVLQRESRHWDYAFVVTADDLRSYSKPFAIAMPSRSLSVAAISIARLGAEDHARDASDEEHARLVASRLCSLAVHVLGDLADLRHSDDPDAYMQQPRELTDLDRMQAFSEAEVMSLVREFGEVADVRLEENPELRGASAASFYLRALGRGWDNVLNAVWQAQPWQFPVRLSRLTTAAASTLLVLLMTAEAWDLGMSQNPVFVALFAAAALLGTSAFVLKRQRLILHRARRRITEQAVYSNTSIVIVVLCGMATMYVLLFGLAILVSSTIFTRTLVEGWAASLDGDIRPRHYVIFSGFIATVGLLIGALGASFEGQEYFRHVTYVDEET